MHLYCSKYISLEAVSNIEEEVPAMLATDGDTRVVKARVTNIQETTRSSIPSVDVIIAREKGILYRNDRVMERDILPHTQY